MNKEEKAVFYKFVQDNKIDTRTLGVIVHHYLNMGEQAVSQLTDEDIKQAYEETLAKEKAAEAEGKVYLISADFVSYILKSCRALLYEVPNKYRYKIIKEYLA